MKPTDFASHLGAFLSAYLPSQRNASPNTVKAYRDAFCLFLRYCRDQREVSPEALCLDHIEADLLVSFLNHLEKDRGNGKSTINQRLAALHAFFRYVQVEEPGRIAQCQRILAIPFRRHSPPCRELPDEGGFVRSVEGSFSLCSGRATGCGAAEPPLRHRRPGAGIDRPFHRGRTPRGT